LEAKEACTDLKALIADADAGMLIGATCPGPAGGEVLGALAVAVHAQSRSPC
jgi:hypothetical protein